MKLLDLSPQFLRYVVCTETKHIKTEKGVIKKLYEVKTFDHVDTIDEAQGLSFLCPKCFEQNKGKIGTHLIICWSRSRGAPDDLHPAPGRWSLEGTSFADLTLGTDAPNSTHSIQLFGGCGWHGFVKNGNIENA